MITLIVIGYFAVGLLTARRLRIEARRRATRRRSYLCDYHNHSNPCKYCKGNHWHTNRYVYPTIAVIAWPVILPVAAFAGLVLGLAYGTKFLCKGVEVGIKSKPVQSIRVANRWFWEDPRERKERKYAA